MIYRAIVSLGLVICVLAELAMIGLTLVYGIIPYPIGQILIMVLFAGLAWLFVGGALVTVAETQPRPA